jgi:hypothetical protein
MATTQTSRPKQISRVAKFTPGSVFDRPIAKSDDTFEAIDWFRLHKESSQFAEIGRRGANPLNQFLLPMTLNYISPLNPVFLTATFHENTFNKRPVWMARDGLLPLLWFYNFHPTPGAFKGRILVHESFVPYVPNEWRSQTGSYSIGTLEGSAESEIREVLFTGIVNEAISTFDAIQIQIKALVEKMGKQKLSQISKRCFLMEKLFLTLDHNTDLFPKIMLELTKAATTEGFYPKTFADLENTPSFEGSLLVDFNEKNLFADSGLVHRFLSRGGKLFGAPETPPPKSEFVQLSAFHGIYVRKQIEGSYAFDYEKKTPLENKTYTSRFQTLMRSDLNVKMPWARWMKEWNELDVER